MSKSVEETRRHLFENDYVQYRQYLKRNKDGSYNEEWVDARWQGFNAALDLIEIELPLEQCEGPSYDSYLAMNADQVRASIESLNLGIKIK